MSLVLGKIEKENIDMDDSKMTVEEAREQREARYKKKKQKEKRELNKFIKTHPPWNDFSRNQKRNMRKRLQRRV